MINSFADAPRLIRTCGGYWVARLKRAMTPENMIGPARMLYIFKELLY